MCRHVVPRICESLELSAADKHKIDCGNAQRLLQLDPQARRA